MRITQYSKPRAVRFKKKVDRELASYCVKNEISPSTLIQTAVECFLFNKDCKARIKLFL